MIFKITWKNLTAKPFSTLLTLLAISLALTFLGSLWTVIENVDRVRADQKNIEPVLTVFLSSNLKPAALTSVKDQIKQYPLVGEVLQISKDQAIKNLELEFGSVLSQAIGKDTLPTALNLKLAKKQITHAEVQELIIAIRSIKGVLELDTGGSAFPGSSQTESEFEFLNWTWVLFFLVVVVVALLVSHLIRLAFEGARTEIETMKIMGASKRFLLCPLFLEGLAYGLFGAGVSLLAVYMLVQHALPLVSGLLLPSRLDIVFLSHDAVLMLVLTSIGASILGALFTMPLITQKQSEIK